MSREAALRKLRQSPNPFTFTVATAGTEADCLRYDIPELFASQRADLRAVVELYRTGKPDSQAFPVLGERGVGKTHLLNTFLGDLAGAGESGDDTVVIVADQFVVGQDAVEFILWQTVNHLLAGSGPGANTLRSVARRTTARLLGEALRRMTPHQRAGLLPPTGGVFAAFAGLFGRRPPRTDPLDALAAALDAGTDPPTACDAAGLPAERAVNAVADHLRRTESGDVAGRFRRELYARLARLSLGDDRTPLDDFLNGEYRAGAAPAEAGRLNRRLLATFTDLFRVLGVPLVVVFDQLEDFLFTPSRELKAEVRDGFAGALAGLINHVPGLCLLIFAERGVWNDTILQRIGGYAVERLSRPFSLPGRPARCDILMPVSVGRGHLAKLVRKRVRSALGDFADAEALGDIFPFSESHLRELETRQTTFRGCLRKLGEWYDQLVFGVRPPAPKPATAPVPATATAPVSVPPALPGIAAKLRALWEPALAAARSVVKARPPDLGAAAQEGLAVWLAHLTDAGLATGWAKAELVRDAAKGRFGHLNLIRVGDPTAPGLGLAAWLTEGRYRPDDLRCRLEFFDADPPLIRTLVLMRPDATEAARAKGVTADVFTKAVAAGRDVRLHDISDDELAAMLAFPKWTQATAGDVQSVGPTGAADLKAVVAELSAGLLKRLATWAGPRP